MNKIKFNRIIFGTGLLYLICIALFLINEWYWGLLIPFGIALVASCLLAMDKVIWFIILSTPLSINVEFKDLAASMNFPNEPFIIALTALFFVRLAYYGSFYPKLMRHPLSLILIVQLMWMLFTAIISEIPLVSLKFFASRLWFVVVFFYLTAQLLRDQKYHRAYFLFYLVPLVAVVMYTVVHHSQYNFSKHAGTWVMSPLFKEHTSYGAVLAMYFTVAWGMFFGYRYNTLTKIGLFSLAGIISLGLILSYTRAAWLSVIIMLPVAVMLYLGWGFRRFLSIIGVLFVLLALSWGVIENRMDKTKAESSDDFSEHASSISNIKTDVSNTERINRWKSAFRMFKEKPHTGFGPGTYMFLYAPYQNPNEKTIISTNAGDVGSAHSEYIGPLAEMGWPGALFVIIWVVLIFYYGFRLSIKLQKRKHRITASIAFLSLVTYFAHGIVNNFLDIDKAALPVFGFTALLAVLDVEEEVLEI